MLLCAARFTPELDIGWPQFGPSWIGCRSWRVLGLGVSLLVRFTSNQASTQDTVGFLPSFRVRFFLFVVGAAFSFQICILPRPAKISLAFLRPALCALFFQRFAPPLCGCSWGFRAQSAGGSLLSSFSLRFRFSFRFFCCWVRPHFF